MRRERRGGRRGGLWMLLNVDKCSHICRFYEVLCDRARDMNYTLQGVAQNCNPFENLV